MLKLRSLVLVAAALLLTAMVVRQAFVGAYAASEPARAAMLWPRHPEVILASGLNRVGQMAATGKAVDRAVVEELLAASAKAPLAPEPYLVRGVDAQMAGNQDLAARAFLEARRRDPHSVAARYFLADYYLRAGRTSQGLAEISALARLVPQSLGRIAPYLAAYARSPGGAPEVKVMLRDHPELEPPLLNALAADADNERLALYLWNGRGGDDARPWQQRLLNSLVKAERYAQAKAAWSRFSPALRRRGELVDPGFEARAPPPFGWTLASGASGVAEPEGEGRLHIIYYGRDDLVLARQLLMLASGTYRFSMRVDGASPAARSLAWTLSCLPSSSEVARAPLAGAARGRLTASFNVPAAGCAAQRLELAATAPEIPEQADVSIAGIQLVREAGR